MNPFQLKIPSRKKKCFDCQTPFDEGESIFSLIKGEEENLLREDYCQNCFHKNPQLIENIWGHWETELIRPKKKLTLDQRALELFIQKYESQETDWIYFLAHYLKRKLQLVLRPELKKENVLFFEDPISSQVYAIQEVQISNEMIKTLKQVMMNALEESQEKNI